MNVLSLFDGMSCGQIALKELRIEPDIYYASEIDKFAIKQTQLNFPDTIQLGDVRNIKVTDLERIDLILGGSPCYNLSMIGRREGLSTKENIQLLVLLDQYLALKEQGVEFTGQSYLFWEFVRILKEAKKINPNVQFLLENVEMGKRWESIFDKALNTKGVHINSALVSAQNRKRIYWTNINDGSIPLPKDRNLVLKDVMEEVLEDNRFLSEKALAGLQRHLKRNKSNGNGFGINCRTENQKSQTLCLGGTGMYDLVYQKDRIRRLTPVERARLQTIPEWYKWECSATQQCRMLGNGWTVDVIVHILSHMKMNEIE